jgi:ABC-type dipeptide/oligopeptide/nickel transport system permease component
MAHMLRGDFGESMKYKTSGGQKSPPALFWERAGITIPLNLVAEVAIFVIAIPVGLAAARRRGGFFDQFSTIVLLGLYSVPTILAGTVLIGFLGRGGLGPEWFPVAGLHSSAAEGLGRFAYLKDLLWHVALPIACMVYGGLAYLAKLGRASLLENLRADYVRTARAKGLPEGRVVYHHAFRNSLLPMITTMVMTLPGMIGGSVIVETIFSIHGMGLLMVGAAQARDLSVIVFGTLVYGALTLLSLVVGDILYAWADPRIRYE